MDVRQSLITHPHPSVRVCAMVTLEGRRISDPRVAGDRALISQVPPVSEILAAQFPAGYWMHADLGISPRYRATAWQVLFLAQFGVGPIPEAARAVDVLRRDNLDADGAFHLRRGRRGQSPALTCALLWAIARLGLRDRADWAATWRWVDQQAEADRLSLRGAVWYARAAAAWGRESRLDTAAIWHDRDQLDASHTMLVFPAALEPDLLAMMVACVEAGAADRIPATAIDWLKVRQLDSGFWSLNRVPGRLWCAAGEVGGPNPWLTVQALEVLTQVG